ncbi:unnamed protein product [Cochlearia groenlandica]
MEDFTSRDSEANALTKKTKRPLEEEIKSYQEKLSEATSNSSSLKEELDKTLGRLCRGILLCPSKRNLPLKCWNKRSRGFTRKTADFKDFFEKLKSTRKTKLEVALSNLKKLESTIEELGAKCQKLGEENGDLAEVNLKLNQELANHGTKANELQTKTLCSRG